jgi:hypothetical protein
VADFTLTDLTQLVRAKPHIASQTDALIMFLKLNEEDTAKGCGFNWAR